MIENEGEHIFDDGCVMDAVSSQRSCHDAFERYPSHFDDSVEATGVAGRLPLE